MSITTYFVQECPTCGRRLQIRVEHLGKRVACQHCQGTFVAAESSSCEANRPIREALFCGEPMNC